MNNIYTFFIRSKRMFVDNKTHVLKPRNKEARFIFFAYMFHTRNPLTNTTKILATPPPPFHKKI